MRKILIAGTMSGSGKTTVSSILMSAFENTAPFKVGPDYIDPSYHAIFTGNKSYNLDAFMYNEETLKFIFSSNSNGKNISIIEGVMGLYDGLGHSKENFSTAHISKMLNVPVILVVNAKGISTSIAAEILGFKLFDEEVNIAGVILNNVSSEKLYLNLKEAVEMYTGIECLGYLPKSDEIGIESRHLGLKQAFEIEGIKEKKEVLKKIAEKYLDLEKIYKISYSDEEISAENPALKLKDKLKGKKIAIAKDSAFSFYYESNLDLIRYSGLEIEEFSPVNDEKVPDADFIYMGGGYPELYSKELSENKSMKESILKACENNIPIYAECGGFIYLTKGLETLDKKFFEFCGTFDIKISMRERLNIGRFGYINIDAKEGISTKGHEFHYSEISENNEKETQYKIKKDNGRSWECGYRKKNTLAGYPHIGFYSNLKFFEFLFGILESS